MGAWHLVGNCLIADEGLCAHDALGERCRRNEKWARNLLGAEAIIFDLLAVFMGPEGSFVDARFHVECKFSLGSVEARAPADPVDGLVACRGNQPGARLVRNTRPRP